MANEIQTPNVVGNFQQGLAFGMDIARRRKQEQDSQQLRQFGQGILSGDQRAYQQAASIDPQAAGKYQDASDRQYRRLSNVVGIMRQAIDTGNPQAIQNAHRSVSPWLSEITGRPVPSEWTPEMLPNFERIEQQVKMAQSGNTAEMPAGFQQFQMTAQAAGLTPGTPEYQQAARIALGQEGRAASGGFGFFEFEGADGRRRLGRNNPRTGQRELYDESTGQFVPLGAATEPAMQTIQSPAGQYRVSSDLSPDELALAQADMAAGGTLSNVQLPPRNVGMPASSLAVGRSPEEQAALIEQAKTNVQLGSLPQELAIRTNASVDESARKAREDARIKREADMATSAQKRYVDATTTLGLLDEAENLVRRSTGSGAGAAMDEVMAAFGQSTEGAQAIAALNPIAAKLTLAVPRMEGPQSDADRLLYQRAAGDLANPSLPVATRLAAMQSMRSLANKYRAGGGSESSAQPPRIQDAAGYNALPPGTEYIAPDGSRRRKR